MIVPGLSVFGIGFARWADLIGSLIFLLLFLMLPDCAYYLVNAVCRLSEDK